MTALSPEAAQQVERLRRFYIDQDRPQALRRLVQAVTEAGTLIANVPERGTPAPRPYPELATLGLKWIKRGRYWIAFDRESLIIAGVFFETSDIPGLLR